MLHMSDGKVASIERRTGAESEDFGSPTARHFPEFVGIA